MNDAKFNAKAQRRKGAMGCAVKTPSWKGDTELHHKDAVNQELVAGQKVEIGERAVNKDIRGEIGEFVGYTEAYVEIDNREEHIRITDLEIGTKHPQRLKRGDRISVRPGSLKKVRGKSGRFDRYADTIVDIDGFLHRPVVGSLKPL